jgi:hypothetical protein
MSVGREVLKWGLVVWLLLPIRTARKGPVDITRIVIGLALFIIFVGKRFYDRIFSDYIKKRKTSALADLLGGIGIILIIVVLVGVLMLFVGYLIMEMMRPE